ncbi:RadC family protein [Allosphingosinicella vermicomposti]|uniref:RadC family protein n=1 Tax=Allosphingosinicella vermicomposti TaxID=614671 RepID=UPI000D0F0C3D|nr:DNA repair protein RadC [Allosphingosinicella vermicomposti]
MGDLPLDGTGHRGRLRQRLFDGGPDALLDHELVEYLLALALPRRDTKPLAKLLIKEFGGYAQLVSADADAIMRIGGISEGAAAALKIAQASALRLLRAEIMDRPVLANWQALLDYLQGDMAAQALERVRVLYLNGKNVLIRDELLSEGTVDEAAVHVREVIRRGLDLHATGMILVHNHPSGDPTPSKQDIALTRRIADAAKPLGIILHDHIIVGARGHSSFRALGLI